MRGNSKTFVKTYFMWPGPGGSKRRRERTFSALSMLIPFKSENGSVVRNSITLFLFLRFSLALCNSMLDFIRFLKSSKTSVKNNCRAPTALFPKRLPLRWISRRGIAGLQKRRAWSETILSGRSSPVCKSHGFQGRFRPFEPSKLLFLVCFKLRFLITDAQFFCKCLLLNRCAGRENEAEERSDSASCKMRIVWYPIVRDWLRELAIRARRVVLGVQLNKSKFLTLKWEFPIAPDIANPTIQTVMLQAMHSRTIFST